ncbi:hypothetical protein [Viridibacillus arvi]
MKKLRFGVVELTSNRCGFFLCIHIGQLNMELISSFMATFNWVVFSYVT